MDVVFYTSRKEAIPVATNYHAFISFEPATSGLWDSRFCVYI